MPEPECSPQTMGEAEGGGYPIVLHPVDASLRRLLWLLAGGAAGMMALLALLPATGHDQMWLLYSARMMLGGATLYGPQLFESNPPLMIWLLTVPVELGRHLPGGEAFYLKLITLLLGLASAWWSLRLFERFRGERTTVTLRLWLGFACLILMGVAPARDFAQRDHMIAMLCLPYVAGVACRMRGVGLRVLEAVTIGAVAGVAVCLKPHQIVLIFALEVALLWQRRALRGLLRPELLTAIACGVAYVAAAKTFAPMYFSTVLPLLRDCYWAFGDRGLLQIIGDAPQLHVLGACAAIFWLKRMTPGAGVLTVAGAAATIGYYLQGTGWYYQQLPAISFFGLALALLLADHFTSRPVPVPHFAVSATAVLIVLALGLTTHFMGYPFTNNRSLPVYEPDPKLLGSLARGTPVYIITTELDLTLPAVYKWDLVWASRMPHLWMLPAILRAESGEKVPARLTPERVAELDRIQHEIITEDLHRWKPRMVFIHRCYAPEVHCQVLEDRHDNFLAWLNRDAGFRAAFAPYRRVAGSAAFDAYERLP